jgi:predicted secreted protein
MALTSFLAIYFILWWVVLFAVLPWGNQSLHETGDDVQLGHASSAPIKPNLGRKFIATTLISGVIFVIGYAVVSNGLITVDDIPFLPKYEY